MFRTSFNYAKIFRSRKLVKIHRKFDLTPRGENSANSIFSKFFSISNAGGVVRGLWKELKKKNTFNLNVFAVSFLVKTTHQPQIVVDFTNLIFALRFSPSLLSLMIHMPLRPLDVWLNIILRHKTLLHVALAKCRSRENEEKFVKSSCFTCVNVVKKYRCIQRCCDFYFTFHAVNWGSEWYDLF